MIGVARWIFILYKNNRTYSGNSGKTPDLRCVRVRSTRTHLKSGHFYIMAEQLQIIHPIRLLKGYGKWGINLHINIYRSKS